jgi:hypothetical protein
VFAATFPAVGDGGGTGWFDTVFTLMHVPFHDKRRFVYNSKDLNDDINKSATCGTAVHRTRRQSFAALLPGYRRYVTIDMWLQSRVLLGRVSKMPSKVTCRERHGELLYLKPLLTQVLVQIWEVRLE